jgi:hypothetical protein
MGRQGHPDFGLLIVDADVDLVLGHSDAKQGDAGTYKHSSGSARSGPASHRGAPTAAATATRADYGGRSRAPVGGAQVKDSCECL